MCVCVSLSPLCPSLNFLGPHVCRGRSAHTFGRSEKWCFQQNNVALAQMLIYWAVPPTQKNKNAAGGREGICTGVAPPETSARTRRRLFMNGQREKHSPSRCPRLHQSQKQVYMVFHPTDACPTHVKWNCICLGSQDALLLHLRSNGARGSNKEKADTKCWTSSKSRKLFTSSPRK